MVVCRVMDEAGELSISGRLRKFPRGFSVSSRKATRAP